jgi:hypothetical protein
MLESTPELQRLRRRSLLIHDRCEFWAANGSAHSDRFARSALVTWRLGRVVTGWLYAQPDRRVHPVATIGGELLRLVGSLVASFVHSSDESRLRWVYEQARIVEHRVADIRALTSARDINEMLSRHQPDVKGLRESLADVIERRPRERTPVRVPAIRQVASRKRVFGPTDTQSPTVWL